MCPRGQMYTSPDRSQTTANGQYRKWLSRFRQVAPLLTRKQPTNGEKKPCRKKSARAPQDPRAQSAPDQHDGTYTEHGDENTTRRKKTEQSMPSARASKVPRVRSPLRRSRKIFSCADPTGQKDREPPAGQEAKPLPKNSGSCETAQCQKRLLDTIESILRESRQRAITNQTRLPRSQPKTKCGKSSQTRAIRQSKKRAIAQTRGTQRERCAKTLARWWQSGSHTQKPPTGPKR